MWYPKVPWSLCVRTADMDLQNFTPEEGSTKTLLSQKAETGLAPTETIVPLFLQDGAGVIAETVLPHFGHPYFDRFEDWDNQCFY